LKKTSANAASGAARVRSTPATACHLGVGRESWSPNTLVRAASRRRRGQAMPRRARHPTSRRARGFLAQRRSARRELLFRLRAADAQIALGRAAKASRLRAFVEITQDRYRERAALAAKTRCAGRRRRCSKQPRAATWPRLRSRAPRSSSHAIPRLLIGKAPARFSRWPPADWETGVARGAAWVCPRRCCSAAPDNRLRPSAPGPRPGGNGRHRRRAQRSAYFPALTLSGRYVNGGQPSSRP